MEKVDAALVEKIAKFKALRAQGVFFNDNLNRNKAFRNPHIYSKLVEFVEVRQSGTNFSPSSWDPAGLPAAAVGENIRESQRVRSEQRQASQHRGNRQAVAFEPGRR